MSKTITIEKRNGRIQLPAESQRELKKQEGMESVSEIGFVIFASRHRLYSMENDVLNPVVFLLIKKRFLEAKKKKKTSLSDSIKNNKCDVFARRELDFLDIQYDEFSFDENGRTVIKEALQSLGTKVSQSSLPAFLLDIKTESDRLCGFALCPVDAVEENLGSLVIHSDAHRFIHQIFEESERSESER